MGDIKNYYNSSSMSMFELLRNHLFFFVDKLRGNKLKDILDSLESFNESMDKQEMQAVMLDDLLKDVKKNTVFYKKQSDKKFNQLPVITKDFLSDNRDEFLSDQFNKQDLVEVSTSGSYGTPMTFYRNKIKQFKQIAEVIYFGQFVNYYFGRNHAFIRAVSKSRINLLLQNEVHIDPTKLDDDSLEDMRKRVKKTKYIIGFPSVILSLIQYCEKMGDTSKDFNMLGIITTAEPLTENQRKIMGNFFRCKVVARYAMEELGIIANQCVHTENYHVNDASFIIEVLKKENDNPAGIGEEGRIIITDLYSNAMPLIRYDTGDYGILQKTCSCGYDGKVLTTISGRKVQSVLDSNGKRISPFAINVKMKDYQNIYQFQFIQEDFNKYKLLLVVNSKFSVKETILQDLYTILGEKADITIAIVDEISPLPSGKRPYIINKLNV